MFTVIFGLPGSGKTTHLAKSAFDYYFKFKNHGWIYTNIKLRLPHTIFVNGREDIGKYEIFNGRLYLDESAQEFNNRGFKTFSKEHLKFFNEYRHHNIDMFFYCQRYDALDANLKNGLCDHVLWARRTRPTSLISYWNIPRRILIAKEADASKLSGGEIVQGYVEPSFFEKIFANRFFGKKYWWLFDSYDVDPLPALPRERFSSDEDYKGYIREYRDFCKAALDRKKETNDLRLWMEKLLEEKKLSRKQYIKAVRRQLRVMEKEKKERLREESEKGKEAG